MKRCIIKILLLTVILGVLWIPAVYAQVDQFDYERPNLNLVDVYGNGEAGYVDGSLEEARFNRPMGAAFFMEHLVIVADTYNGRIRLINLQTGIVSTFLCGENSDESCRDEFVFPVDISCGLSHCWALDAGDGSIIDVEAGMDYYLNSRKVPLHEGKAIFKGALGVVEQNNGERLLVADTYGNRIWAYETESSSVEPLIGNGEAGYDEKEMDAILTRLNNPTSMVAISNSVMIVDARNAMVREAYYSDQSKWIISTFSGGGPFNYLTQESDLGQVYDFGLPFRITYTDLSPGLFFISIPARNQLVCLTFERQAYVVAGIGSKGDDTLELKKPYAIAAMNNRLMVFDSGNYMRLYSIKKEEKN